MNKKNLIVVDLDNTLVPFDTFKLLVLKNIFNVNIIILLIIRRLRLMSALRFKKNVIHILSDNNWLNKKMTNFVSEIISRIDKNIIEKVNKKTTRFDYIILCSASPDIYVKEIAKRLGWQGFGSSLERDSLFHMFGINKIKFICEKFPTSKYFYKYSISNSLSDLELLKLFDFWEIKK